MVIFGVTRVCALRKRKSLDVRMGGEADPADRADALGLGLHAVKRDALVDLIKLDALQALEEIELIPGAAELAVGGKLQPDLLLLPDRLFDLAVFDRAQRVRGDLIARALGPRLFDRGGPQQAADMVGAKRRRSSLHPVFLLPGALLFLKFKLTRPPRAI